MPSCVGFLCPVPNFRCKLICLPAYSPLAGSFSFLPTKWDSPPVLSFMTSYLCSGAPPPTPELLGLSANAGFPLGPFSSCSHMDPSPPFSKPCSHSLCAPPRPSAHPAWHLPVRFPCWMLNSRGQGRGAPLKQWAELRVCHLH